MLEIIVAQPCFSGGLHVPLEEHPLQPPQPQELFFPQEMTTLLTV
jgi:hypothetical protein